MKARIFLAVAVLISASCDDESLNPSVEAPTTYRFERNGQSTVSFDGQSTRIAMSEELISSMKDLSSSGSSMLEMFRNETANGGDANPFEDVDLNGTTKSIKSKTAASEDFFSANTVEAHAIKEDFEMWINAQVTEVFPNDNQVAIPGRSGQIADGSSIRFVSAQGLEYNQAVSKSLIGALMGDQVMNHYLGTAVLDEADNRGCNDAGTTEEGKNYTTMEHKWDEAYGYIYGASANPADPNATIGTDDNFFNKYIGRVEGDNDFAGIADEIYDAFKLGRAAIVAKKYTIRNEQASVVREKLSIVIAVRAVFYMQQGKNALPANRASTALYGGAFHDLSEGFGFIYSLRFTRQPSSDQPYFSKAEVNGFLEDLMGDGTNGLWDVEATTLDNISEAIAAKFNFTVDQAGS